MARKLGRRDNRYLAKLVTGERKPCAFCLRQVDDEVTYGKLYAIGDIQCHYFCCLLSCCLIQKGHDEEGLFGFMYADILAEVERCKKHKCSYCSQSGANLGCSVGACRKQFHLPCGREKNAISLYYGTYKSFCQQHAPKQKITDHIMANAKYRLKISRMKSKNVLEPHKVLAKTTALEKVHSEMEVNEDMVCVICYEAVDGFPTIHTFWPPCCARDAWFHRTCLQRMALSAGMHYLKCPLCNDKENFYDAVVSQGYYVPDRDAAWELEQNAFAEIYERPVTCCADECTCPNGREHDAENGQWDIKLCLLCGSTGIHAQCFADQSQPLTDSDQSQPTTENADHSQPVIEQGQCLDQSQPSTELAQNLGQSQPSTELAQNLDQPQTVSIRYVCRSCMPAAPEDLNELATRIEAIIQQEQTESTSNTLRPVMPSRMSLRRTKGRRAIPNTPSSSRSDLIKTEFDLSESPNVRSSRLELNLKTPRKPSYSEPTIYRDTDYKLISPVKLLEQTFKEKMKYTGVRNAVLDDSIIEKLRRKFRKPRPLCEKKRIVNNILDGVFDSLMKDAPKQMEVVREWCSPKKSYDPTVDIMAPPAKAVDANMLEMNNDKENISNTCNTHTKKEYTLETGTNSIIFENDSSKTEEIVTVSNNDQLDIEKTLKGNMGDSCGKTGLSKTNVNEEMQSKYVDTPIVVKEKLRARSSISKTICPEDDECKIQKTPTMNMKEYCRKTRSSLSRTNIESECKIVETPTGIKEKCSKRNSVFTDEENEIENTPTKIMKENCRKTRSSLYKIFADNTYFKTDDNTGTEEIIEISEDDKTPFSHVKGNFRVTRNSASAILNDSDNSKADISNTSEDTDRSERPKFKLSMPKNKNRISAKNIPIKKPTKDTMLKESQYTKMVEDSKLHGEFLRKLMDEEDLCAKLLSELTRNEYRNEVDKTPNKLTDSSNNLIHISNNLIDASNVFLESPSNIATTPNFSIDSASNIAETPNILMDSPSNIAQEPNNLNKSPKNLTNSPNRIVETPKRKTIDIQQDSSLEISENDQSINIDVIKIDDTASNSDSYKNLNIKLPDAAKTCAFKFSPIDKETLKKTKLDIDLESFKKEYLNEVDREFMCNFKHKHLSNKFEEPKLRTAIDFAMDAVFKKEPAIDSDSSCRNTKKRKMSESGVRLVYDKMVVKKRKTSESDLKLTYSLDKKEPEVINVINDKSAEKEIKKKRERTPAKNKRRLYKIKRKRKTKKSKRKSTDNKNIEVTIDSSEKRCSRNRSIKKKTKTKFTIRNENVHVRIKWKKKQLSLNIESKKQAKKEKKEKHLDNNTSKFKQYVLKFPEGSSKDIMVKPEKEVCPLKRKYIRQEKSPDKLKQMSIHSFFKVKSSEN